MASKAMSTTNYALYEVKHWSSNNYKLFMLSALWSEFQDAEDSDDEEAHGLANLDQEHIFQTPDTTF